MIAMVVVVVVVGVVEVVGVIYNSWCVRLTAFLEECEH